MRVFVAIEVGKETKERIENFIKTLKTLNGAVRWVNLNGLHITLRFLGETEDEKIELLKNELNRCSEINPFMLNIKGTGVFPDYRRPRVLWIGVEKKRELENLFQMVDNAVVNAGFEREERTFHPHITIGRVKKTVPQELLKRLRQEKETPFGTIEVNRVLLMQSILKPTGAEYKEIFEVPLGVTT